VRIPAESEIAALRASGVRFITLERSIIYQGDLVLNEGRLCDWTADRPRSAGWQPAAIPTIANFPVLANLHPCIGVITVG